MAVAPFSGQKAAQVVERVQNALTYQPRTTGGEQVTAAASYPFEKLAQGGYAAGAKVADLTGSPAMGAAMDTAIQTAPALLLRGRVRGDGNGSPVRSGGSVAAGEAEAGASVPAQAGRGGGLERVPEAATPVKGVHPAIEQAQSLGYILQPSQVVNGKPVGSLPRRIIERGAGKAALPAELSIKNAEVTRALVAEEIGINPKEPITPAKIAELRNKANQQYTALEKVDKRIDPDVEFFYDLNQLAKESRSMLRGDTPDPRIVRLTQQYQRARDGVPIAEVMKEVRELRFASRKNYAAEKPETVKLGENQRKVADSLEAMIERQVSDVNPNVVENWRAARQQLAKLHLLSDAMKGTEIDPRVFGRALDNGEPLTGRFKEIAEVANNFPQVMQAGANLGSKAGAGLLDVAMSVPTMGAWAAGRFATKKLAATRPIGRPATRAPGKVPTKDKLAEIYLAE
jgi:hypothetical protein